MKNKHFFARTDEGTLEVYPGTVQVTVDKGAYPPENVIVFLINENLTSLPKSEAKRLIKVLNELTK